MVDDKDRSALDEVVQKVGEAIGRGDVPATLGHAAIGATAAWLSGFPHLAWESDEQRDGYTWALRTAGAEVPW